MRVLVTFICAVAFFLCLSPSRAEAQRLVRRVQPCPPAGCLIVTTPSAESQPEAAPAPQPWLLTSEADDTHSQPPDTALEPVAGTGSKSPTSLLAPKVVHGIDPATFAQLKELLQNRSGPQSVSIGLPMDPATMERSSRLLMILEWCAWLAGALLGHSAVGKLGPLGALLANGLRSAIPAPLPAPAPTPVAPSLPAPNP